MQSNSLAFNSKGALRLTCRARWMYSWRSNSVLSSAQWKYGTETTSHPRAASSRRFSSVGPSGLRVLLAKWVGPSTCHSSTCRCLASGRLQQGVSPLSQEQYNTWRRSAMCKFATWMGPSNCHNSRHRFAVLSEVKDVLGAF